MSRKSWRIGLVVAMVIAVAAVGLACSNDDATGGERPQPTSPPLDQTQSAASLATRENSITPLVGATVGVGDTTVLIANSSTGPYLTDKSGFTLYTSLNDAAGSGTTACLRSCGLLFPPLVVESGEPTGPIALTGPLATFERIDDQRLHVTYKGQPLYRYNQDAVPGESKGNGLGGGIWLVAVP